MKYNKGFAPVVILLIILGVLAIGGVAYYAGKNDSKIATDNPTYSPPVTQNTNNTTSTSTVTACTTNSSPSITVLSPNGGEVYQAGKQITVKWTSCNLAKTTPIQILLQGNFSGGPWSTSPGSTFDLGSTGYGEGKLLNSGSATVVIPTQGSTQWSGYTPTMKYGNYYKVYISQNLADYIDASDMSDNSFTISNNSSISTTLPQYIGAAFNSWPPVIQTSSTAYSCKVGNSGGDTPTITAQRVIGKRTYCVSKGGDGYAGGYGHSYTYTTTNGSNTETTNFTLLYQSCGVWQGDGTTKYDECRSAQSNFDSGLDTLIDSLM